MYVYIYTYTHTYISIYIYTYIYIHIYAVCAIDCTRAIYTSLRGLRTNMTARKSAISKSEYKRRLRGRFDYISYLIVNITSRSWASMVERVTSKNCSLHS